MEESLIALLLQWQPLRDIVQARIGWVLITQGSPPPYVVMTRVSGSRDTTFSGPSGLVSSRVQVDCYAETYISAKAVARAVEARLSGFKGELGPTFFDGIFLDAERDLFDADGGTDRLHRVSLDFLIWHKGA
jgi:hypothetical protein